VNDAGNARVQVLTTSGSLVESITLEASFNPCLALDSSGNLWSPGGGGGTGPNWAVIELNSSGTYTGNYLDKGDPSCCEGSANGLSYGAGAIAFDKSGNVWIIDPYNQRLEEFNSSGSFMQSVGGPAPYTCETSPASYPACAAGSGQGQFNFWRNIGGIAIFSPGR